jgi:type III pantothenate kinase
MILELDIGNSRIKWRQLDEREGVVIDQGHVSDLDELQQLDALGAQPLMVRMSCVRDKNEADNIGKWVRGRYSLEASRAEVTKSCGSVTNSYEDVSRMGVDRWLAMLAAYQSTGGPCVVVDGGTALTVDIVAADGQHQGGYILPGLQLMRRSLVENTGIRISATTTSDSKKPGRSTDEAVLNGTLAVLLALIEQKAAGSTLLLTGGDAQRLASMLPEQDLQVIPSLVLDGLAIACPLNSGG